MFLNKSYIIQSQVTQEWTSRYGLSGIDGANSIAIDTQGDIYVTGSDGSTLSPSIATIKYSSSGEQLWIAKYIGSSSGYNGGYSIKVDKRGNIIVTGTIAITGNDQDIITIKYNQYGDKVWVKKYTDPAHNDFSGSLEIDSFDNVYISGTSNNYYITIKYDSSGIQQWIDFYDTLNHPGMSRAMTIDKNGNLYVTGESGDSVSLIDIATIKYNSSGVREWVARFNSPLNQNDYGLDIATDTLGNVYVCGGSQGDLFYDDFITVKYDSSGVEKWYRKFNGSDNFLDQARSLVIDNSNNVYVTGYSTFIGTGYDFTTIKYNTNGDQIWIKRYNNGLNDLASKIIIDDNANLYITGQSDGSGTGNDYATVKYDSAGNQIWVKRYDYSGQFGDYSSSIAADDWGSVFVTGSSDRDYLTIKYSQLTGGSTNLSQTPKEFKLEQNYPNPFNPTTVVSYQLPVAGFVLLKVYDVLGNEVSTLVNKKKSAGNYQDEFNGENFPSGIYFYSLEVDGNRVDSKKMLLIK